MIKKLFLKTYYVKYTAHHIEYPKSQMYDGNANIVKYGIFKLSADEARNEISRLDKNATQIVISLITKI
jgi:hypothetical protein